MEKDSLALGGAKGEGISVLGHWPEVGPPVVEAGVTHMCLAVTQGCCSSASQPFLGHRPHRK